MQVSERVLGFIERRGRAAPETFKYGPTSEYSQRRIDRFFQTTGVCWYFPDVTLQTDALAAAILKAFCIKCAVQERDLGVGRFHAQETPLGLTPLQGICIYDAADGSLRLTQRLAEGFAEVLEAASALARSEAQSDALARPLEKLEDEFKHLERSVTPAEGTPERPPEGDWVVLVAPGSRAIYASEDGTAEVEVVTYRYTPQGLLYELMPPTPGIKWLVKASSVQPMHGQTKTVRVNLVTEKASQSNSPCRSPAS